MKKESLSESVYRKLKPQVIYTDIYSEDLNDSLDYAGEDGEIAFVGTRSKGVSIVVSGETAFITPDGTRFKNRPAESENYHKNKVEWTMNNWFGLVQIRDGKPTIYEFDVRFSLDEAIKYATEILGNQNYWVDA